MPMNYLARAPLLEVRAVAQDISDHGRPSGADVSADRTAGMAQAAHALRQQRYDENKPNRHRTVERLVYRRIRRHDLQWRRVSEGICRQCVHRRCQRQPDSPRHSSSRWRNFPRAPRERQVEFLASTDVWFRPCNFTNAPDGNLYVTDIYRQVIETPESIPEEIRKKIDFYNGDTLGRIYRIVPNHPRRQGDLKPNLGAASSADLVKHLANANGWHRQTAHRLLLERQDRSAIPDLKTMAATGASPEARVHALWLLQALRRLDAADVERAMKDAGCAHPGARASTQRAHSEQVDARSRTRCASWRPTRIRMSGFRPR